MRVFQRQQTKLAVWAAIPLLAFGIAGCGALQDKGADEGKPQAEQSLRDWSVDYASCMRQEGVDVPDPGKDGQAMPATEGSPLEEAASKTCLERIGDPPVGDKESSPEEVQEGILDTNKCLRENGVDVKDPVAGGLSVLPEGVTQDTLDKCGLVGAPAGG